MKSLGVPTIRTSRDIPMDTIDSGVGKYLLSNIYRYTIPYGIVIYSGVGYIYHIHSPIYMVSPYDTPRDITRDIPRDHRIGPKWCNKL